MESIVQLSRMESGQKGVVKSFSGEERDRYRLMEMGVLPGTDIRFVRRAPLGDPIEVEIRGFHLSLRSKEADNISISIIT